MDIFYVKFYVRPTKENEKYDIVEGAYAHCWIKECDPKNAYIKAEFYVLKAGWKIAKIEAYSCKVDESDFLGKDIGIDGYKKAISEGIFIVYVAWSRDGKTTLGPCQFKESFKFPVSEYISLQKNISQRGRCLHYDSGNRCDKIIKAHSIQKNKSLSAIAQDGHVYKISSNFFSLKSGMDRLVYEKSGINKVSTFLGFCKRHDNELFWPIDNNCLVPTDQQILLYSYRSLCRELFVSENALELANRQLEKGMHQEAVRNVLSWYVAGKSFGLKNLRRHKRDYDKTLASQSYSDINYVIFISSEEPVIAFSGIFYPDFDFLGRQLQNLGDQTRDLQLLTFCSAPITNGWAYLFAWHETSSKVCTDFMRSLATTTYSDISSLSNHLFRLAMTNCENLAISPRWWESLDQEVREKIADKAASTADIFSDIEPSYLMDGLDGISGWKFDKVFSKGLNV